MFAECLKQFLRFCNLKLNMLKTTEIISYDTIESVREDIFKFIENEQNTKSVYTAVFDSDIYDYNSTQLMHELSFVNNVSILDYCMKDLNQLLILRSSQKHCSDEYADSLIDLLGWFYVHKRVYPNLHFDSFTITEEEIIENIKTITYMKDYYNMHNKKERLYLQSRGLLIEQKVKELLKQKHCVVDSHDYSYDFRVDDHNIDVKSYAGSVYRLPYHRFVTATWDYVIFVKIQKNNDASVYTCEYAEMMSKDLLYYLSINYATMLLVNLQ